MAEGQGGEREGGGVRLTAFLCVIACVTIAPASAQTASVVPASNDARRIVAALRAEQQIGFMIPKLSPVFAQQMLTALAVSERFKAQLASAEGRSRLQTVIQEEFERAFRAHVAELVEGIARDYDKRLAPADLHSVAEFVSSGAGARWATVVSDIQQQASGAGARLGALAGEEAYEAVLKRLDAKTGLVK